MSTLEQPRGEAADSAPGDRHLGDFGALVGGRDLRDGEPEYRFRPRGLDMSKRYRVSWDNRQQSYEQDGSALVQDGLLVRLEGVLTSELLMFEAL